MKCKFLVELVTRPRLHADDTTGRVKIWYETQCPGTLRGGSPKVQVRVPDFLGKDSDVRITIWNGVRLRTPPGRQTPHKCT